jgi:hypothetical protein
VNRIHGRRAVSASSGRTSSAPRHDDVASVSRREMLLRCRSSATSNAADTMGTTNNGLEACQVTQ